MTQIGFLMIIILLSLSIIFAFRSLRKSKKHWLEITLLFVYLFSLLVFGFGFLFHNKNHHEALDPVDECYSPLGGKHQISLILYFIFYNISAYVIWIKGRKTPPLFLVFCLIFMMIGIVLSLVMLIQFSYHNTESLNIYKGNDGSFFFLPAAFFSTVIGILLLAKLIAEEKTNAENRIFKNQFLNRCNVFLSSKYEIQTWAFVFLFPVFFITTLILILLGQDYNSLVKVFTDTTTWAFSQKSHPPILDHRGHYLCTVSAKGDPKLVKPIYLGKRHGNPIIVNRQLQIANAFEELIGDISPAFHRLIRKIYDQYGYNLSLKINTEKASNITYILMKPLEWFFLISLYLCCEKPETKIKKQYL